MTPVQYEVLLLIYCLACCLLSLIGGVMQKLPPSITQKQFATVILSDVSLVIIMVAIALQIDTCLSK